jgi:hypothetical protein
MRVDEPLVTGLTPIISGGQWPPARCGIAISMPNNGRCRSNDMEN